MNKREDEAAIKKNPLKEKLLAGKPVLGVWSIIPSPVVAEIFAFGGIDFAIFDMEHGIFEVSALDSCIRACESAGSVPLVRLPGANPWAAQWALDLGAYGIVVPQISSQLEAQSVVSMAKYSPVGSRGYNPFTRAAQYANPPNNRSGKLNNNFSVTCVIVENQEGLNNLSQICEVPDIDVIYLGIYDLAVTMGFEGDTRNSQVVKITHDSVAKILTAGKSAGMIVRNQADIIEALALGANFLVYSVDTFVIREAVVVAVSSFKNALLGKLK